MKRLIEAYIYLSKTERMGIIALMGVLIILFFSWTCMQYFVRPAPPAGEEELMAAWHAFKSKSVDTPGDPIAGAGEHRTYAEGFAFDPNTADSNTLLALGLSPRTAYMLLNWRRKGKRFYRKEDLKGLYTLTDDQYRALAPHIVIAAKAQRSFTDTGYERTASPQYVELNTADSAMIVRVRGIGPVLAHKIIERRKALGGFLRHEQLLELYRFPDTAFHMLQQRLTINPSAVKRININTASEEVLGKHPYIGEKMAKNIILMRSGLGKYENMQQLRQVPLMNEEIYRKIVPYIILE